MNVIYILYKSRKNEKCCLSYCIPHSFCPKYRKKVLAEEIAEYLKELFTTMVVKRGWKMISLEIRPDHVHLFIGGVDHKYSSSDVVKYLKGVSSYPCLRSFPN